jgi:aminopeptidase-like protein
MSDIGSQCYYLIQKLFPICRSITGDGVRQTLDIINHHIPVQIREVPSCTEVFDWKIPKEWNIRNAYIKNSSGEKIIDFNQSNLHVVNYSIPVHKKIALPELKKHLHSLPEKPNWIPYKTSYYKESWGFCLSHNQLLSLSEDTYEVCIDSSLESGSLTYGEFFVPGKEEKEILLSTHICHPSLCNDNLSGVSVATYLAQYLSNKQNRYSYRFLFIPGTIGAITWLAFNQKKTKRIKHGLVLSGLGDSGALHYKRSRQGNAEIDQVVEYVLFSLNKDSIIEPFYPYGYDERQFCSPGFDLPVGRVSRTPYDQYPEYHTSADNLEFVTPEQLKQSFEGLLSVLTFLENNYFYKNLFPFCEPQLGKRGLYESIGEDTLAMLWVLNLSDGQHSLFDIARRSGIPFNAIIQTAKILEEKKLVEKISSEI